MNPLQVADLLEDKSEVERLSSEQSAEKQMLKEKQCFDLKN